MEGSAVKGLNSKINNTSYENVNSDSNYYNKNIYSENAISSNSNMKNMLDQINKYCDNIHKDLILESSFKQSNTEQILIEKDLKNFNENSKMTKNSKKEFKQNTASKSNNCFLEGIKNPNFVERNHIDLFKQEKPNLNLRDGNKESDNLFKTNFISQFNDTNNNYYNKKSNNMFNDNSNNSVSKATFNENLYRNLNENNLLTNRDAKNFCYFNSTDYQEYINNSNNNRSDYFLYNNNNIANKSYNNNFFPTNEAKTMDVHPKQNQCRESLTNQDFFDKAINMYDKKIFKQINFQENHGPEFNESYLNMDNNVTGSVSEENFYFQNLMRIIDNFSKENNEDPSNNPIFHEFFQNFQKILSQNTNYLQSLKINNNKDEKYDFEYRGRLNENHGFDYNNFNKQEPNYFNFYNQSNQKNK